MAFGKIARTARCGGLSATLAASPAAARMPRPAHAIYVMEENHSYTDIIGSQQAPYINGLAQSGALFTDSHATTHPSQPNYLELFSGSTQGVANDSCPHSFAVDNGGERTDRRGLQLRGLFGRLAGRRLARLHLWQI